jgi:hypothetical protein
MEQQRIEYNVFEKKSTKSNKQNNKTLTKKSNIKSKQQKTVVTPLIKSNHMSVKAAININKTLSQLHKDLIGNILLIHFFQSKNKKEFIDNINNYSIQTTGNGITLEQIHTFKKLYKILKSSCNEKCRNKSLKKQLVNDKKQSKKLSKAKKPKLHGGEFIKGVKGGPYLYRLTEKGDKPITGNDLKKSLKEITEILDLVRHVDEGKWVKQPNMLISYFNGDQKKVENYLKRELLPKYINMNTFPPTINFSGIMNKISNASSWVSIYNKDKEFRKGYIKEKGLDPAKYLKASKYDKMVAQVSLMDKKLKDAKEKRSKLSLGGLM